MKNFVFALSVLALIVVPPALAADGRLTVHEWGTFTSLQGDDGRAIAGVNTDDEPVPSFVHSIGNAVARGNSELSPVFESRVRTTKGNVPRLHPDVTMRLETPVIYFYLPGLPAREKRRTVDVRVAFNGGWLSQYYPDAQTNTTDEDIAAKRLTPATVGTLAWKGLEIGAGDGGPATQDKVWLAPRRVKAASLRAAGGESEKFLFYRGVGHLEAPIAAVRKNNELRLEGGDGIHRIWRVDVRGDGTVAYRRQNQGQRHFVAFTPADYSKANLKTLRRQLHAALKDEGLYGDEATAMLETWDYSYFRAAGERVFYIVPPSWTNKTLPLEISAPADITRVMIGRIELLNPVQQEALARLRSASLDGFDTFIDKGTQNGSNRELFMAVSSGKKPISALGADVPPAYKDYLLLGRFRDAVVLNEQARRPKSPLARFIEKNDIAMHKLP